MASEAADIPQAVNEKIEAEDGKLIKETTNIELDKILKEERMDAEDTPCEAREALKSNFEVVSVKNTNEGSAEAGEGENFFNLPSIANVSVEANNSSPEAYEVIEKPDQTKQDAWKIQSLEDEKLDNRLVEIIATKETSSEEIQQNVEKLSISLDEVEDRGVIPVESTVESADATSELKVEDSTHAPDSKDARTDTKKLKDTSIGETGAEKFGSDKDGKLAENFDVALEKGSQETITLREDTIDVTKDECQLQDQNNSECSFLEDAEDVVIQEGDKTATVQEVSEMVLESILNQSAGEEENQSTNLKEVRDRSIQTATEKTEEISLKQVDEPQIKHDECLLNESGKLSSTEEPAWDTNHEGIEAGDLKKGDKSEDERSSENYLPYEKPVESLHVAPEEIRTSASCQNERTINPSLEQIHVNPEEILGDETKDNTIDAANKKDVATIDPNEEAGGSIPYCCTNDLNVTHPPEEGNENDGPSIDAHHDPVTNSNICNKEEGDQINTIEDQDHSEALLEVREDQSKETESQVNDDRQVTSKPDDTEQMMDKEQDTTIQSEATADETIKIFREKTELEVAHSSENIKKIILFNENRNQHIPVASILEEKIAESLEGDKNITDILSQEMEDSYQVHDECMDNSMNIINADSGAKDFTVLADEKTETGVPCEKENEIKEPDTEILERRIQSQDMDKQIMMETDGFKDNCTATLEESSAKEISQEDEESKEIVEAELSTREVLNVVDPASAITENKLDENLNKDERNVIISEQEIKNTEKEGTGENFKGTHFSEDSKAETLDEEESSTSCIIKRSIQSEEQEMWSKDCLDSAQNLPSEGSSDDIIVTPELAVTVGTEDPNLEEVKLLDKLQLDENDLASEKLGMPTSKSDKEVAESKDIKSENDRISNLGENRDVNLLITEGNEADETDTGEITKYEIQNETQAALSKCNDQVAAAGNVSHNTLELNLGESYDPSYEEHNVLPVSDNESKDDNSENIEGSSIIPDSSSAEKTTENIDTEKDVVGQKVTARNSDDFLEETLDTQKPALESKTEHENRMEYLDINSKNSMTEKDLETDEPTKEPPSTSELVIELQGNKSNPENTITAVVDDGIKTTEEKNESIGEILTSQHSLDGKVDTDDDGRECEPDGRQHVDSIQGVKKAHESDNTTEQEEKVIEQDFESSQREASCEKEIQLGADDPNDRAPNCNQIITDGSLYEEILQVQRENENADSRGKIKEQIEEEGCPEDVQKITVADVAMHEEKGLESSTIKNLGEIISDDGKEKISLDIAEDLSQEQEESSVTEVPKDEKLAHMTSLASVATEENSYYKIVHEPCSFHDKTDAEDVHVIDAAIKKSSKENLVQVDPEESTDIQVPCGEKVETMQQDTITVLEEIVEQPRNASEAVSKGKITLDIAEDLNHEQEESSVTRITEDEKLANMTSLASVATEENSDYKIDHEPSSFHDKTDAEVVHVIDASSKENLVQVDPEESTDIQVPCGKKVETMQQDTITVLEEIVEQPRNASEAVSKGKITLDIAEDLNHEQEESSVTRITEDKKLANMTSLASVATEENSDYKIDHEPSSFHDKTDAEDVHVIDASIKKSSKDNLVQVDSEESTDIQVPCGEKVKTMQQDTITVLEEIVEQPRNASEAVSKGKITLDIAEDLNHEQGESSVTRITEDEKLANMTSLASVATEENSDYKIDHEPSSFHDKTDTEDVQLLDDSITFSSKENLVQVDLKERPEHNVPYGERMKSIPQDPITVLEEIEEQEPRNASDTISEEKGVNFEGAKRTTDNCEEITDSSNFVELDEIPPSNPPQESRKETVQMAEDKGTEKQQDDLHTLAHTKDSPMEITQKDAPWCVASIDGSEDTGVMDKFVAAIIPEPDENMVEAAEVKESEFADNSTSNENIQQLQQEDTSETFQTDVKNTKPAEGELEEANCVQEKIIVETIESRKESTSIEIAKGSPPDILQIYSKETSHVEDHSIKEKKLTINREELHVENTEPIQDEGEKLQEDKEEEDEAGNPKMCAIDVAIHEEKGQGSSSIKNLAQTNLDDIKEKITQDIFNDLNRKQEELSVTKMSIDEKLPNTISLASKATEENSESNTLHERTDTQDVQVLEDSITCSYKENTVQVDPKESMGQVPSGEKVELLQQDSITVLDEIEEQQTGNAFDTVSEAKGVNSEGEKGINDYCKEIVASSSFVAIDEIPHSNPLPESSTQTLQEGEGKETLNQHEGIHILAQNIDSPMEITQKDAQLCIASSDDNEVMHELEVASLPALDKHVVDEANYEETSHVEDHSTKDRELTINKEELHVEKIEPIEDKGAKMQEEKEEEEEAGKLKTSDFGSQALTLVEERDMDVTGSVSEAPDENLNVKFEGEANKFNDKTDTIPITAMKKETRVGEICDNEKCTNSHDETPEIIHTTFDDLEGQEVESEAVAEDAVSVPQSETVDAQHADTGSAVNKKPESNEVEFADEENIEHGDKIPKDEDSLNNSAKKEEVDNLVDSNLEFLQPDKLEKVLGSETQVQSFEVITGGQMKSEEENLEAAKEEIRAGKIGAEIFESNESKKINMPSEKIKDETEAVEDCQLGSPAEATIPERCQEGEEKPEEDPKVKTEEAIKCENEKVSENFEEAYVKENVSEHIVFENKAVEEPKESIDEILHVKEEGNVETEREVKNSAVAFLEHGEDRTGANEDTGLQNRNINFSPMEDTDAGKPQEIENIISEAAPTKLIYDTIKTCEDNKEIVMREKEGTERKDEKLTISESLGDEESDERQDKNQHQFNIDKQLKYEVCMSNRVQEKEEEQVMLSEGEGEVIVGEADTCSRQTEDENEKPDFSSHSKDTSDISHGDGVLGIAKDNENSTNIRILEKIFTGTTKSEISEAICPNESGEAIISTVSEDIQPMEQDSEAITVDAEMHESKAGTASSDVQETMGVQYGEEGKENDDYKEMIEISTSMQCAISTSKIMQGSAKVMSVAVEDQETQDQLIKLQHLPRLPNIQASEMGETEEVGPVDLQRDSNITGDMQELDERSIALSNKENLAEMDPIIASEFIVNNNHVASDKVTPSNMLQGSASEAAQDSKDKNTPTQHNELPILSDFKYSDMERTQADVELCVERVDSIDVTEVTRNLDVVPVHESDKQIITDADLTKNMDAFNSAVENKNIPQLQQDTTEIFQAEVEIRKPSGLEQEEAKCGQEERTTDETSASTNKSASTEIAKPSLSDLLQGPLKESSEMADHHAEGRKLAEQKEELKAGKTEEAKHEEEKYGHEESIEQKISDLGSEAPVMVDAGDVDAKIAHKKSHNILSGVGSKMKHSIAKVKKAITGKSSHPKPPPPKESVEY